uniref:Uncharacterized protein n=1 Tax=Saimiri boliviensis boliviensis TaxID=39432 RepID=A0A2K6V536_SAIBB
MRVEECFVVMYWYKQIQYKLTNADLKIMHIQCSNVNFSHGFLWCGPIKAHFFFPKMFFPMYPIMDTGFVHYDSITEMNDFLFLKFNH